MFATIVKGVNVSQCARREGKNVRRTTTIVAGKKKKLEMNLRIKIVDEQVTLANLDCVGLGLLCVYLGLGVKAGGKVAAFLCV